MKVSESASEAKECWASPGFLIVFRLLFFSDSFPSDVWYVGGKLSSMV
jgi:hypothetical protein